MEIQSFLEICVLAHEEVIVINLRGSVFRVLSAYKVFDELTMRPKPRILN